MRFLLQTIIAWSLTLTTTMAAELWVDADHGDDTSDGQTAATALRTLQAAANLATPGTLVHIQPGIYRETVKPANSGTPTDPIVYRAEQPGTVYIRGSEAATTLTWSPLTENTWGLPSTVDLHAILWADVSAWSLTDSPRFLVQTDTDTRLPLAREPDWIVQTEWQYHKFWWSADGGSVAASCDPSTDAKRLSCDSTSRSATQLTDTHDDTLPAGVDPGHLSALGDLTGATVVAMDTIQGRHVFQRQITAHDVAAGRVTVDREAYHDSDPAFGWGSQYYVENHPALLDNPGEYGFDPTQKRLYLWATTDTLSTVEIAHRNVGWDLSGLSYITLDGFILEIFNDTAILIDNDALHSSHGIQLRQLQIRHANRGIVARQTVASVSSADAVIDGLVLEDSNISDMDTTAIELSGHWDQADNNNAFVHPPITHTIIRRNEFHHLGFRSQADDGVGIQVTFADHLRFENNHIHHVAHDGIQFSQAVQQTTADASGLEIKTGDILLKDNVIEKTCQLVVDCGGVRFWGIAPTTHIFRDVLIVGNTLRHIIGWSFISERRRRWANGYFGSGIYGDSSAGFHIYRNHTYDNGWAGAFFTSHWRDGVLIIANNVFAEGYNGINAWLPSSAVAYNNVNTQIINNILVNNENFGIEHSAPVSDPQFIVNHNLYEANGWKATTGGVLKGDGESYTTLTKLQAATPWEAQGVSGQAAFVGYENESERQNRGDDVNLVDFHLVSTSAAIDRGTTSLPESLVTLLHYFEIEDEMQQGSAWDMGAFEFIPTPTATSQALNVNTNQSLETTAQFTGIVTTAAGLSGNGVTVTGTDDVQVTMHITVDPDDVGQAASIILVGAYLPTDTTTPLYFIRQEATWQLWPGTLTDLAVATTSASLPAQMDVEVFRGQFANLSGQYIVFVGYLLANGHLVFNRPQTLQLTVTPTVP